MIVSYWNPWIIYNITSSICSNSLIYQIFKNSTSRKSKLNTFTHPCWSTNPDAAKVRWQLEEETPCRHNLDKEPLNYLELVVKICCWLVMRTKICIRPKSLIFLVSCMHLMDWFLKGTLKFQLKMLFEVTQYGVGKPE